MKLKILILSMLVFTILISQAQSLDRITISAGGNATDEVSFSLGETMNFALADGDLILETGSQGSITNTGGTANNFVSIENVISANKKIACYPNPTKNMIYFNAGKITNEIIFVKIIDISGKTVFSKSVIKSSIMDCDLTKVKAGNYILSVNNESGQVIGSAKFVKQ